MLQNGPFLLFLLLSLLLLRLFAVLIAYRYFLKTRGHGRAVCVRHKPERLRTRSFLLVFLVVELRACSTSCCNTPCLSLITRVLAVSAAPEHRPALSRAAFKVISRLSRMHIRAVVNTIECAIDAVFFAFLFLSHLQPTSPPVVANRARGQMRNRDIERCFARFLAKRLGGAHGSGSTTKVVHKITATSRALLLATLVKTSVERGNVSPRQSCVGPLR